MALNIDKLFAGHARALAIANQRLQLLAANVANADTPNYKARDIDFKSVLGRYQDGDAVRLATSHAGHSASFSGQSDGAELLYRTPLQPTLNGNTVDTQLEQSAFLKNALAYETTLSFLNSRIQALRLAIRGD